MFPKTLSVQRAPRSKKTSESKTGCICTLASWNRNFESPLVDSTPKTPQTQTMVVVEELSLPRQLNHGLSFHFPLPGDNTKPEVILVLV